MNDPTRLAGKALTNDTLVGLPAAWGETEP